METAVSQTPVKPFPDELRKWSWGGAGLTWIWGIRFSVWLALLSFVPYLGGIWWIVLGIKGHEWAWNARPWTSVEEYKRETAPWELWGKILFIVSLVLPFLLISWAIALFSVSTVTTSVQS